jgi:hypothetical protein
MNYLDIANNPFIDWSNHGVEQLPNQWETDDVACAKVHAKLRREIMKLEFKLAHPPLMYNQRQRRQFSRQCHEMIAYWTSRLSDAHYN